MPPMLRGHRASPRPCRDCHLCPVIQAQIGALDQPPQHGREVWRLIERMSAEDLRAFSVQGVDNLMHLWCGLPHLADSFAGEEEVLGIDVTGLYEATGLLCAPAGVRLVHQSALVVHEVAQVPPRTGQALAKVVGSDLQHLSSNGVAYIEDCTEDEGQALLAVKAEKHSSSTGEHRLGHQQVSVCRCAFGIGQL